MWKNQRIYPLLVLPFLLLLLSACASAAPAAPSTEEAVEADKSAANEEVTTVQMLIPMTVYKSPTCGCCGKWVDHMQEAGFEVTVDDFADMSAVKEQHGIQPSLQSCHTALIGDYIVEGHVPADAIQRLLTEQPDIKGLAVPGMPIGSPGMEVAGHEGTPYTVLAFDEDSETTAFANYPE